MKFVLVALLLLAVTGLYIGGVASPVISVDVSGTQTEVSAWTVCQKAGVAAAQSCVSLDASAYFTGCAERRDRFQALRAFGIAACILTGAALIFAALRICQRCARTGVAHGIFLGTILLGAVTAVIALAAAISLWHSGFCSAAAPRETSGAQLGASLALSITGILITIATLAIEFFVSAGAAPVSSLSGAKEPTAA
jgi:hypothetical protein